MAETPLKDYRVQANIPQKSYYNADWSQQQACITEVDRERLLMAPLDFSLALVFGDTFVWY